MQEKKKFYAKKWFMWVMLFLFPPIGITLVWICHKDMKKKNRIILSVVFVLWFMLWNGIGSSGSNSDTVAETIESIEQETTTGTAIETTVEITTETATKAITEVTTEDIIESTTETTTETATEAITNAVEESKLSTKIESNCRAITKKFVERAVQEDYSMLAFSIQSFDLDENENGTIKILYLPSDAGKGSTKVNLTVTKKNSTYKIEEAMLSGLYEVDLNAVSKEYTEFIYD